MQVMMRWIGIGMTCMAAVIGACAADVNIAERPSAEAGADAAGGGDAGAGGSGVDTQAQACADAISAFQACMTLADFESSAVYELAFVQTADGPCASCHQLGEHCAWLGYNVDEMYYKWQSLPCMGDKLVACVFDADGNFVDLEPSEVLTNTAEQANQLGTDHPAALVPSELKDNLEQFIQTTLDRWRTGGC